MTVLVCLQVTANTATPPVTVHTGAVTIAMTVMTAVMSVALAGVTVYRVEMILHW